MKKIGIFTWFVTNNYGTALQSYATAKFLENNGYDCYFITNTGKCIDIFEMRDFFRRLKRKVRDTIRVKCALRSNPIVKNNAEAIQCRKQLFADFLKENYQLIAPKNNKDFSRLHEVFDLFLVGSDQVWNPYYIALPHFLNFVHRKKPMFSYATSLGVSSLPPQYKKMYQKYLSRFQAISVREKTGADVLQDIVNSRIEVVVDPVFLLSKAQWEIFTEQSNIHDMLKDKKYVLCYFLGNTYNYNDLVKHIQKRYGADVITVVADYEFKNWYDNVQLAVGPYEFVDLISNAQCVCTDSFHAFSISVCLQKNMYLMKRFDDSSPESQNSRLFDLADKLGLQDRFVNSIQDIDVIISDSIEYKQVEEKLSAEIERSKAFLLTNMERQ